MLDNLQRGTYGYTPDREYYVSMSGGVHQRVDSTGDWFTDYKYIGYKDDFTSEPESNTMIAKELTTALVVSSSEFARQAPAKQTETLASANGKAIVFVRNFAELRNKKALIERLLKGEDVSMELEFNEIELSTEERTALDQVRPIIERVRDSKVGGPYPWLELTEAQEKVCAGISFTGNSVTRQGYNITMRGAEKIWNVASKFWAARETDSEAPVPGSFRGSFAGYSKYAEFAADYVRIGCQTIQRYEVEFIAQHFGFEPNLPAA